KLCDGAHPHRAQAQLAKGVKQINKNEPARADRSRPGERGRKRHDHETEAHKKKTDRKLHRTRRLPFAKPKPEQGEDRSKTNEEHRVHRLKVGGVKLPAPDVVTS